ncbi:LysM peptidoglycan-binding domain-containing protein [Gammaproteobacteria bacterium AS21]
MKQLKRMTIALMLAGVIGSNATAANIALQDNHPNEYVVKKGDTLWDIAGVFLKSPSLWPRIWENNNQISNPHLIYPKDVIYLEYRNGQPYLTKNKSSVTKLSPKIREGYGAPITAIADYALKPFVVGHTIVASQLLKKMPYVLSTAGLNSLVGKGDEVYVRGVLDPEVDQYDVYRLGQVYDAKFGLDSTNTEIVNVGMLTISNQDGEINKAVVVKANDLIRNGDIVVRHSELDLKPIYYLAPAPKDLKGEIIAIASNVHKASRFDSVVINMGLDAAVYAGHVFNIVDAPLKVEDPRTKEIVLIDNQVIGKLMVVNVFENISYAIILESAKPISPGATLKAIDF